MPSVFADAMDKAWPHKYNASLLVSALAGGVPSDPNVAEGWLKSKLADKDELIRERVAEVMAERGIDADTAAREVDMLKHLNGFKRTPSGQLYIEGRQLKAAIREAANVARAVGKLPDRWGLTRKGITGFVAEHIMVMENELALFAPDGKTPVTEPDKVLQSFPKNARTGQTGIQYTEVMDAAVIHCTIIADHPFSRDEWAMLWLTGEQQGVGASRSQGFGKYEVIEWADASPKPKVSRSKKTAEAEELVDA
jgi:hypothetical protein